MSKELVVIGYSGHSYVAIDIAYKLNIKVSGYCELNEKSDNPYLLKYLGSEKETEVIEKLAGHGYFVAIGDNSARAEVSFSLMEKWDLPVNLVHPDAFVSDHAKIGHGILVSAKVSINSQSIIGNGVICNTGSIIEHECQVGSFAHIGPGSVLCGSTTVGARTLIGANSVIIPGISIGSDAIIGAGSVVLKDVPDGAKYIGNPARKI